MSAALLPVLSSPDTTPRGRTLIVVGHGSHLNADSAQAACAHARSLRASGQFEEVLEAYWKEEPSLRQALRTARYREVTVLPAFISEGYFTEQVIPRELGLDHQGRVPAGGVTQQVNGKTVHYTRPYGVHPAMTDVLLSRAREVCPEWDAQTTALVVLGHGTRRNARSREAIENAAQTLAATGLFARAVALYLDEPPHATSWPEFTGDLDVIMVPFFASEGWHTQETIPAELGLSGPVSRIGGRQVYYARPVGTHPDVKSALLQLVREAGGTAPGTVDEAHARAWNRLEKAASAGLTVGELRIEPFPDGFFDLRNTADVERNDLRVLWVDELNAVTGRDDAGAHRPIRTRAGLPQGWRANVSRVDLRRALHAVYPTLTEEASAFEEGALRVTPWHETAARQSGLYRRVQRATPPQLQSARETICSGCLRTPLWAGEHLSTTFLNGHPRNLPCAEACTLLVSEVAHLLEEPHP
ncbi:CbiX/SirB N-terminal domain-containing protein [Deinococcus fonticola]|uniref:CbiX/SirB N-terminal domain-containing protein n=1 Tax=Deinococcus fonticola TaxID=2528713 RepID=UPI001F0F13C0|nr:CbiX/SirB N-terminal domain-containing protein [Deinococcus fonticola]